MGGWHDEARSVIGRACDLAESICNAFGFFIALLRRVHAANDFDKFHSRGRIHEMQSNELHTASAHCRRQDAHKDEPDVDVEELSTDV